MALNLDDSILEYLYTNNYLLKWSSLDDFIKNHPSLRKDNLDDALMLSKIIESIQGKYAEIHVTPIKQDVYPLGQNLSGFGTVRPAGIIEHYNFAGEIKPEGRTYIRSVLRERDNDSVIAAQHQSTIETNDNIRLTNNSIRSLNTYQKFVLGISLFIAGLTTYYIILTYRAQKNDTTQESLKELVSKETELLKSIKDIQLSLKDINASIQHIATDTIVVKGKRP